MRSTPRCVLLFTALGLLCLGRGSETAAQEPATKQGPLESTVEAPPNTRTLGDTLGGAYFVDGTTLDKYESLKTTLQQVHDDLLSGATDAVAATQTITELLEATKKLRAELEEKKVLVSAFQVYRSTSEQTFALGDERLVLITGDRVAVGGWEGPGIKCVVEKIVLAKEQPPQEAFDSIQVHHELTVPEEKVGMTPQQWEQQEKEFLASEEGLQLTDEQRANRRRFVDQIQHSYDVYSAFQGRQVNTLRLSGLLAAEGNQYLSMDIRSPGGGGMKSSRLQRYAKMTVYLPPCRSLAIRGCLGGLDVQQIQADLVLTTHEAGHREYGGSFQVQGVQGNVTIDQVPVRLLSDVTGNVRWAATSEFVNSGTRHVNDTRTFSPFSTNATRIERIAGDLQAEFLRTELQLQAVKGTIDVVNRFGDTQCTVTDVSAERAHRIVSDCGIVSVQGPAEVLQRLPISAYTQCGRLHTNLEREELEPTDFATGRPQRNWHGLVAPELHLAMELPTGDPQVSPRRALVDFDRPEAILENRTRKAGLDLLSHAGKVSVLTAEKSAEGATTTEK